MTLTRRGAYLIAGFKPNAVMHIRVALINPISYTLRIMAVSLEGLLTDFLHSLDFGATRDHKYLNPTIKAASEAAMTGSTTPTWQGLNRAHQFKQGCSRKTDDPCCFDEFNSACDTRFRWVWLNDKLARICSNCSARLHDFRLKQEQLAGHRLSEALVWTEFEAKQTDRANFDAWKDEPHCCPYCRVDHSGR